MVKLTDKMIIELLQGRVKFIFMGGIILILIGLLACFLQATSTKKRDFKNLVLPVLCFFIIFCGLGSTFVGISVFSYNETSNYKVTYGYISNKNWEYKLEDSEEKKHYVYIKEFNNKITIGRSTYESLDIGDKVIVVYKNKKALTVYDASKYQYVGNH